MRIKLALTVDKPRFGGRNARAGMNDLALGPEHAGRHRDRANEVDLEFERREKDAGRQ